MGAGVRFFVSMALVLLLASAACSQPCQPYQVLGVIQYSNGAHPSGENISIIVEDLNSGDLISYIDVGGGYSPNTGSFQLELGNFQKCVEVGDVLRLTVVDGKAGGAVNLTSTVSDENVVAGGDTKFGVVMLTIPSEPPSCGDGVQNQGEEGVDCGGRCKPCFVPTTTLKQVPTTTVQVLSSTITPVSGESTTTAAGSSVKPSTIVSRTKTANETKLNSTVQQQKQQGLAGGGFISEYGLIILAVGVVVLFALLVLLAVVLIYLGRRKQ